MNEQLLLSKAFWSIDEFNQATINLWELKSRIDESLNKDFESPTERITKVDLNTYIDSIIVFIESLPKFIGLFDTFNSPVYRGIDLGKSYEFFKQIFYTYCYIIIFGKEFKIIIGQELLHRISLDKYLSEYINAYKLGTTNYSMLFFLIQILMITPCYIKKQAYAIIYISHFLQSTMKRSGIIRLIPNILILINFLIFILIIIKILMNTYPHYIILKK